jgi:hypothetical protein
MNAGEPRNLSASIRARLMNCAHETGDDFQNLMTAFFCERFLYRLSASSLRLDLPMDFPHVCA